MAHIWAKSFSSVSGSLHRDSQAILTKELALDPKGHTVVEYVHGQLLTPRTHGSFPLSCPLVDRHHQVIFFCKLLIDGFKAWLWFPVQISGLYVGYSLQGLRLGHGLWHGPGLGRGLGHGRWSGRGLGHT